MPDRALRRWGELAKVVQEQVQDGPPLHSVEDLAAFMSFVTWFDVQRVSLGPDLLGMLIYCLVLEAALKGDTRPYAISSIAALTKRRTSRVTERVRELHKAGIVEVEEEIVTRIDKKGRVTLLRRCLVKAVPNLVYMQQRRPAWTIRFAKAALMGLRFATDQQIVAEGYKRGLWPRLVR